LQLTEIDEKLQFSLEKARDISIEDYLLSLRRLFKAQITSDSMKYNAKQIKSLLPFFGFSTAITIKINHNHPKMQGANFHQKTDPHHNKWP